MAKGYGKGRLRSRLPAIINASAEGPPRTVRLRTARKGAQKMSFLAKRLAPGESLVYRGRFHVMQQLYAWGALLLLGIILVGIYIWIREMVRLNTTEFLVTNRRVMLKTGWLSVHVDEITLGSIEGGQVDKSILGRLFGYGRLTMRGRGDTHLQFPTMAAPNAFRSAAEGPASPRKAVSRGRAAMSLRLRLRPYP